MPRASSRRATRAAGDVDDIVVRRYQRAIRLPRRLVAARVGRHLRQHGEGASLAAQDGAPEAVGILREDVLRQRLLDDPRLLGDLALELAGTPAGVAGEDAGAVEA